MSAQSKLPNFTDPGLLPGTPFREPAGGHGHLSSLAQAVVTAETTTSTTYTDLATAGPSVTLGARGQALVILYCHASNNTLGAACAMAVDISGANTQAAADTASLVHRAHTTGASTGFSAVFLVEELNAGSTTFTAKYRVTAGTGTFDNRRIAVIPIPTYTHPTSAAPGGGT